MHKHTIKTGASQSRGNGSYRRCGMTCVDYDPKTGQIRRWVFKCGDFRRCPRCRAMRKRHIEDRLLYAMGKLILYWREMPLDQADLRVRAIRRAHGIYVVYPIEGDRSIIVTNLRGEIGATDILPIGRALSEFAGRVLWTTRGKNIRYSRSGWLPEEEREARRVMRKARTARQKANRQLGNKTESVLVDLNMKQAGELLARADAIVKLRDALRGLNITEAEMDEIRQGPPETWEMFKALSRSTYHMEHLGVPDRIARMNPKGIPINAASNWLDAVLEAEGVEADRDVDLRSSH